MPITAFIGVRISWLIVARNALLASLAASASRRARSSSVMSWYVAMTPTSAPLDDHGMDGDFYVHDGAVLAGPPCYQMLRPFGPPSAFPDARAHLLARLRSRHQILHGTADCLRLCVSEEPLGAGIPSDHDALQIHGGDRDRARLHERVRVLLLALDLMEQPGVVDGQHRLGREGLQHGDDLGGERAPLAPENDEAAEEPPLADERDGEERAHAFTREERPHLRRDERQSVSMSATCTGSRVMPARPMAPSPRRTGVARSASSAPARPGGARAWNVCAVSSNS